MKYWLVGTGLVIGGVVLAVLLMVFGVSVLASLVIGIAISISGYFFRRYIIYRMKISYKRNYWLDEREHEELMKRVPKLPLDQTIQKLLDSTK